MSIDECILFAIVSYKDIQLYGELMKIAISSPAGNVDKVKLAKGISFLESRGHQIVVGETINSREFWTAGSAVQRAAELERFWCDESIDVVWAARGGFGCAHILELLDWSKMAKFKKNLCGHSDISVLHLAFLSRGVSRTLSASMPAVEFAEQDLDSLTIDSTFNLLADGAAIEKIYFENCQVLKSGQAKGYVVPVTLSVLCSLLGSDFLPNFSDVVLVLEDVNEAPYRIDAYMNQLKLSGILTSIQALVLGDFKNCGTDDEQAYIYNKYAKLVAGPVLSGLPFGHCLPRLSLPVGSEVKLSVTENKVLL